MMSTADFNCLRVVSRVEKVVDLNELLSLISLTVIGIHHNLLSQSAVTYTNLNPFTIKGAL